MREHAGRMGGARDAQPDELLRRTNSINAAVQKLVGEDAHETVEVKLLMEAPLAVIDQPAP